MRIAPAIPASVSENSYGPRIWFRSDETLLKNPTYTAKGIKISQNSRVPRSCRVAGINSVRGMAEEALGGVGGADGRKNDGSDATVDYPGNTTVRAALRMPDRETTHNDRDI